MDVAGDDAELIRDGKPDSGDREGAPRIPGLSREPEASSEIWSYLGVGCLTAIIGLAGGGMIGVLIAKLAGAIQGCVVDPDTRAPCDWDQYWTWGARIGLVFLPVISIWRLRRGRRRRSDND